MLPILAAILAGLEAVGGAAAAGGAALGSAAAAGAGAIGSGLGAAGSALASGAGALGSAVGSGLGSLGSMIGIGGGAPSATGAVGAGTGAASAGAGLGAEALSPALSGAAASAPFGEFGQTLAKAIFPTKMASQTIGPTIGNAANLAQPLTGVKGFLHGVSPDIYNLGSSVAKGDWKGVGGSLGNMMGGKNLGNFAENPSWETAGKAAGEMMNPTNPLSPLNSGGQQAKMPPLPQSRGQAPRSDDPIINKIYQNFNPQQTGSGMKPWGQSPFPKKMSSI